MSTVSTGLKKHTERIQSRSSNSSCVACSGRGTVVTAISGTKPVSFYDAVQSCNNCNGEGQVSNKHRLIKKRSKVEVMR